jgi:hypothetical protein
VAPAAARAADDQWQIGSAPSVSSGTYGTDTQTEILQTPITARRLFRRGDMTIVFPFVCIWGTGNVTLVNGVPVRTERLAASRGSLRGTVTTTPVTTRNCGMGDIVVRGRYYLVDEHGWLPTVTVRAHLKTPTASVEQGLGTGEPDEGIGLEVSRTFKSRTTAMVDGGYTAIGSPSGVTYNNNWWYDAGFAQDIGRAAKPLMNVSVFFEEYRAVVSGLENARDVLATVSVKIGGGWRVDLAGEKGLSTGAPDHAFMLAASRRF